MLTEISVDVGPADTAKCPDCGNSMGNTVVADYRFILCCASCKTHFINHLYRPTAQETFTLVKNHLLKQMDKAQTIKQGAETPICAYRGNNGKRCAIGCLIPDPMYDASIEGQSAYTLFDGGNVLCEFQMLFLPKGVNTPLHFLKQLQSIHDDILPCHWEARLKRFAEEYNLQYD
jgi:hypothetical protein